MAAINRYQGNSGRLTRIPEQPEERRVPVQASRPAVQPTAPRQKAPQGVLGGLEDLGRLLPARIGELETEDIILLLILYLMYRESGDSELLMIMGAMFLL